MGVAWGCEWNEGGNENSNGDGSDDRNGNGDENRNGWNKLGCNLFGILPLFYCSGIT